MRADVRHIAGVIPSRRRRSGPFRNRGRSSSELSSISDIIGGNSIGNEEEHALLLPAYVLGSLPRGSPFAVDYKATALWQVQEGAKLMLCCGNYRSPMRMLFHSYTFGVLESIDGPRRCRLAAAFDVTL